MERTSLRSCGRKRDNPWLKSNPWLNLRAIVPAGTTMRNLKDRAACPIKLIRNLRQHLSAAGTVLLRADRETLQAVRRLRLHYARRG